MKSFLVIGMGRFGTAVAQELTELGQEVLAIDENVESVQRIADDVTQVMQGDAQDEAVLGAIGVRNFDCCIVAVGTDMEASILITVMLKELGAQYSPRLSPAVTSGFRPLSSTTFVMARQVVTSAACVYSVRSSFSFSSKHNAFISICKSSLALS